jgi:hypothetical protein
MEKTRSIHEGMIRGLRPAPDYSRWTIEELRQFALQLRVRDARQKNRRELVELFEVPNAVGPFGARRPLSRQSPRARVAQ